MMGGNDEPRIKKREVTYSGAFLTPDLDPFPKFILLIPSIRDLNKTTYQVINGIKSSGRGGAVSRSEG